MRHGSLSAARFRAGPWDVEVAHDSLGVSWVRVYDCVPDQQWERSEMRAQVGVEDGVALLALRDATPARYWRVDGPIEGAVVVCDDGLGVPRIVGVALVGPAAGGFVGVGC